MIVVETMGEVVEYLGQVIKLKNRKEKETKRRIKKGWASFWNLRSIFTGNIRCVRLVARSKQCVTSEIKWLTFFWRGIHDSALVCSGIKDRWIDEH